MTEVYVPYPDAELVLIALLEQALPEATVDTFMNSGWEPPLALVNRIGGAPDVADITDYPIMRVAFYGDTRNVSWNLAARGEGAIMLSRHHFIDVPDVGPVLLDFARIEIGGQMLPDLDPDDRRVVKDFTLGFRRQYHLAPTP